MHTRCEIFSAPHSQVEIVFAAILSFDERRVRVRDFDCFCFGTAMMLSRELRPQRPPQSIFSAVELLALQLVFHRFERRPARVDRLHMRVGVLRQKDREALVAGFFPAHGVRVKL